MILESFPIIENGGIHNLFNGFVSDKIELKFQEGTTSTIAAVSGGTDIIITSASISSDNIGYDITFISTVYGVVRGTIFAANDTADGYKTTIPYISNDTGTCFIWRPNLRMEYRFCEFTTLNDQDAPNLFPNTFTYYPNVDGTALIDISIIKSLFVPNLGVEDNYNNNIFRSFQVQYKELYDSSSDTWHSANDVSVFSPFVSVHGGGRIALIDYTNKASPDAGLEQIIFGGYDKYFTTLIKNDDSILIQVYQYDIGKNSLGFNTILNDATPEVGLYNSKLPALNVNTRFVRLAVKKGAEVVGIN